MAKTQLGSERPVLVRSGLKKHAMKAVEMIDGRAARITHSERAHRISRGDCRGWRWERSREEELPGRESDRDSGRESFGLLVPARSEMQQTSVEKDGRD